MNSIVSNLYHWPKVGAVLENIVDSCELCYKYRIRHQRIALVNHKTPTLKVSTAIAECFGELYLMQINYFI